MEIKEKIQQEAKIEEPIKAVESEEKKMKEEGKINVRKERRVRKTDEELREDRIAAWVPKTEIGNLVKAGKEKDIDNILENYKILESEIVDSLLNLKTDLLAIGQSKGKYGGGKRRIWRQTQRKTAEGNIPTFACMAVVGNEDGYVGIGVGKSKETLPAREKAGRKAKLNLIKITRGCGSFDCSCDEKHSIPFQVEGKCSSSKVILYPAPQGTGLVIGDECKRILKLAGIKDIYSKTFGQTRSTMNLAKACIDALKKTNIKLKE